MPDLRSMDDAALLAAEQRMDAAWVVFSERYRRAVFGYFRAQGVPPQDAADLVQDTFFAAFRSRKRFRPDKASGLTWLLAIAEKKRADRGRRFAREEKMMRNLGLERIELTHADVLDLESTGEDPATRLLDALPPDQRAAVQAKILDERGYDEISEEHGITRATARKRLSRGLDVMRRRLQEEDE